MDFGTLPQQMRDPARQSHQISLCKHFKGYHIIFRYENWNSFAVDLGAIYVRGVCEIALCKDEIVLMSKYENMKVNVNYKSIEKVEIMDEY